MEPLFDRQAFARRIRVKMAEQNLSQREAQEVIGVDHATLHRVSRLEKPPSIENYLRITRWLDADPKTEVRRMLEASVAALAEAQEPKP